MSLAGLGQLEELAAVAREAGLDVKLEVASPPRALPPAVDRAAYRILQEAVTNAIGHAGPARLVVSVATARGSWSWWWPTTAAAPTTPTAPGDGPGGRRDARAGGAAGRRAGGRAQAGRRVPGAGPAAAAARAEGTVAR
jgi:hypothetical protein